LTYDDYFGCCSSFRFFFTLRSAGNDGHDGGNEKLFLKSNKVNLNWNVWNLKRMKEWKELPKKSCYFFLPACSCWLEMMSGRTDD
jgi:hypothetical protein